MASRLGVAVMALCLLLYIVLLGGRAFVLVADGQPIAVTMGIALLFLPVVGVWALGREIVFGMQASRLGHVLEAEGSLPDDDVTVSPSGRVAKDEAPALRAAYEQAVAAHPEDWRARFRWAIVQDATGDRRGGRASVREAIRLERATRSH